MSFEWEDSDEKYEDIRSTNEMSLADIMYGFDCAECGEEVWSEDFDADPDNPVWYYSCHECELRYRVYPTKVRACASDADL